jgi:hypothetical protein
MRILCRCPPELLPVLPRPVAASSALPEWLRAMPSRVPAAALGGEVRTLKHCPPFLDALSLGILVPLACDVEVRADGFAWSWSPPPVASVPGYPRAPLSFHLPEQATGAPFAPAGGELIVKLTNFWTLATEPGWSLLVMHPLNRPDLPFHTLAGLVDTDSYGHGLIHFPALWRDPAFRGVLRAGTPIAQCIALRRGEVELELRAMNAGEAIVTGTLRERLAATPGVYRRERRSASDAAEPAG